MDIIFGSEVKAAILILFDKGRLNNYVTADEVLKRYLD